MYFGAKKNDEGQWVFTGSKYQDYTFDEVASQDPRYLQFACKKLSVFLEDEAYYALEDAMKRKQIPFL